MARSTAIEIAHGAGDLDDVVLIRREPCQERAHRGRGVLPLGDEVRADVGVIQARVGIDPQVLDDDDLAGRSGFLESVVVAGGIDRVEDDDVDGRIPVELVERGDLVLEAVLGIEELQRDAILGRGVREVLSVRGPPGTLRSGLDESDDHVPVRVDLRRRRRDRGGRRSRRWSERSRRSGGRGRRPGRAAEPACGNRRRQGNHHGDAKRSRLRHVRLRHRRPPNPSGQLSRRSCARPEGIVPALRTLSVRGGSYSGPTPVSVRSRKSICDRHRQGSAARALRSRGGRHIARSLKRAPALTSLGRLP